MQIFILVVETRRWSDEFVNFSSVGIRLLHRTMFSIYLPTLQKVSANCVFECILAFQTRDGRNVYTFLSRTVCQKNNLQRVTLTFSHVCVCHVYIRIFGTSSQWARPVLRYNYSRMCPKIYVLLVNMKPPMKFCNDPVFSKVRWMVIDAVSGAVTQHTHGIPKISLIKIDFLRWKVHEI